MTPGYHTYLRFKAKLVLKDVSLTAWAAQRGTGPQQLRSVVQTFAGSDRLPRDPLSQQILAAVYAELSEESSKPDGSLQVSVTQGEV